ncbi:MAG: chemotaxis protein CheW [Lachnospiraceae bacterium]|nr:chemotaxis protein CheW [Lachnospiraceae bacterium]
MQLLTFTLGGVDFAVPLKDIELVDGRNNKIVELPAASAHIKGIMMVRGVIVPIYSLASRFGYSENKLEYFIILNVEGIRLGIEVDMVNAVIDTERTEIFLLSPLLSGKDNCLKNIISLKNKQLIILIDVSNLIQQEEREEINRLIADNM